MVGYSGTKEEINQKQRDYYARNRDKLIGKSKLWKQNHSEQVKSQRRERYLKNRDKELREQSERNLIENLTKHGCCVVCFEDNPLLIESHHIFIDEDLTVGLCKNCHHLMHFGHRQRTPEIVRFYNSE